ncbi:insulinase family protein [Myxococcota bacterium]|nr:insulinase family protein [Myxococcota bacterium]
MRSLLAALGLFGAPAAGGELSPPDRALVEQLRLPVTRARLDNGLRVVVQVDRSAPLVASHLLSPVGAARDRGGPGWGDRPGLAHLAEHLLYAGSPGAPDGGYDALLSAAGGENNAWTEHHALALHAVVPVEALDLLLWLEADRMAALDPDSVAARLSTERAVVAQERAAELETPGGSDGAALRALLYPPAHPERWPVLGSPLALASVTTAEVLAFHRAALAPEGAVLVLVGDVDPADALARVEQTLGRVPPRPAPPPPPPSPSETVPAQGLHLDDVAGTTLYAAWPLPPPEHVDAPAVDLLADLLGQQRHGHLGALLARGRLERAAAWVELTPHGGRLVVELGAPGGSGARLLRHLERALAEVTQGQPPDPAQVERLRARWRSWAARLLLSPPDRAEVLATCVRQHDEPGCFPDHLARHLAVDGPALQAAARRWLDPERRALLVVASPRHARRGLPGSTRVDLGQEGP